MIGTLIDGKYEIRDLLGEGGMGQVYEAAHTTTGRRCAVKVISAQGLTKDPNIASRFQREARAAGAVDTQYIAQVLDAGVDRDTELPFMVVEYLDGQDLQGLLKSTGPLAPDLVVRMAVQTCLGLQKAHEANVVHRDIKPANLFLTKRDAGEIIVKVLDFGIAKVKMDQAHSKEGAELTKTGNLLGSPMYMSPEQARGQRGIDHRTDIWSLGAVMYQALAGRTPFQHATALGELILFVCSEPPPPLQDHAPWVPAEIAQVVHTCLTKNPDERYQSAQAMFDAMVPLLPGGWAIHESMLVSLEDSQRMEQAPRLPMSVALPEAASPDGDATVAASPGARSAAPPAAPEASAEPPDAPTEVVTTGGAGALAASQPIAAAAQPKSGSKTGVIIGAAVGALVLVGGGGYVLSQSGGAATAPTSLPTATEAPTATAEPTATATATAQTTAPADAKPKRVHVVILPADAKVEVEGELVQIKNGILEIEDIPGSVHRVTITKGRGETTADVVVTEAGALPPKIEITPGRKIRIPRPGETAAPTTAPPTQPVVPKGISTATDEFK